VDLSAIQGDTTGLLPSQNWRPNTWSIASGNEMTAEDWWFSALDQRPFIVNNGRWTTQVVGVYLDGIHTWIQIAFAEHSDSSLLLYLGPTEGLRDAIELIRAEIMQRDL
jgi:hypothetical protein